MGGKPSGQGQELTTNSTHMMLGWRVKCGSQVRGECSHQYVILNEF